MAREGGHPDIAKIGEATHFGKGQDPRENGAKAATWSIRNMVRYFAANDIPLDDADAIQRFLGKPPSRAQLIALKALKKAEEGDMRAIEYATDQIDGKVAQPFANDPDNPLVTNDAEAIVRTILGLAAEAKTSSVPGKGEVDSERETGPDNASG